MHVLHVYAGNLYGGVEKLLVTLARERERAPGLEQSFALCFEGRLWDELRDTGIGLYRIPTARLSRPWTMPRARRGLAELLRKNCFDAVITHSTWLQALFGPVVRQQGARLVFWSHDSNLRIKLLNLMAARVRPDQIIANSRFTQSTLHRLFPGLPSEVLYCPVGPLEISDPPNARREVRLAMGVSPETTVIFMAARLEPWKGHGHLLDALGRMAQVPGWVAWIGGGPQRPHEQMLFDQLKAKAGSLGLSEKVRFIGQRSDVPKLLCAADIHCQPNTGPEPFGIAFIEALQAGLPVVTTCIGAAPEIINDTCGKLAPPGDSTGLADILRDLINDPAQRACLAAGGPARARELCDVARQLRKLQQLLAIH